VVNIEQGLSLVLIYEYSLKKQIPRRLDLASYANWLYLCQLDLWLFAKINLLVLCQKHRPELN